ncbi:porin [Salinivibrio kushneri]|uniref:porin n=1 Tax=Salinivibrio kushneri TaxID=1908198 RepID=UPI000C82268F|nr:porin [Salinivibrio kushneri]
MKKTILAMAVPALLAAGSASASINLYDANGVKVDASGAAEVQYMQEIGNNQDAKWRLDDGDVQFDTEVTVSDKLSAIAAVDFEFESADEGDSNGDVENNLLYVGLKGDWGQFTAGRQLLLMDDAGITKDYELSVNSFGSDYTHAQQVGKYVYDNGTFYGAATFTDKSDGVDDNSNSADEDYFGAGDDTRIYEARLGYRVADVDARVYYQRVDNIERNMFNANTAASEELNQDAYNFEIEYAGIENVGIAASIGRTSIDGFEKDAGGNKTNNVFDQETDYMSIAADYTMGKTTFGVGYDNQDKEGNTSDVNGYYANVTYALHSNAKVYAEVGDSDGENEDFGYVAGMEVKF